MTKSRGIRRIQGTGLVVNGHQPPPSDEILRAEQLIQRPGTRPLQQRARCPKCGNRHLTVQPVVNERGLPEGDLWDWNCFCGWVGDTFRRPILPRLHIPEAIHRYV